MNAFPYYVGGVLPYSTGPPTTSNGPSAEDTNVQPGQVPSNWTQPAFLAPQALWEGSPMNSGQQAPVASTSGSQAHVQDMLKAIFGGQQAEAPGVPASGDITWIPFNMERTARRRPGEGEFECTMCVKKFSTLKALKEHSVAHTNLRPFSCDVCDKTFKYQSNLFEHRTIHYPTRVHFCPFCGKQIRLKGNLKKHLATHIKSKAELEREWERYRVNERPAVMPIVRRPRFANQRGVQTVEYWTDLIQRNLLLPRPPLEPLLRNLSDKLTEAIKQGEDLMEVAKSIAFESYSCPVCMLNFTDKAACEQHLSGKHADVFTDDKRNLYCGMCVRLFATDGEKELHDLIHDRVHRLEEEGDVNLDLPPFL